MTFEVNYESQSHQASRCGLPACGCDPIHKLEVLAHFGALLGRSEPAPLQLLHSLAREAADRRPARNVYGFLVILHSTCSHAQHMLTHCHHECRLTVPAAVNEESVEKCVNAEQKVSSV